MAETVQTQQVNPAAAAAPTTPAAGAGQGDAANAPWYPDTQKALVESKGWKSPADLLTSYTNLEQLMGADKAGRTIVRPKDANDVEGNKAFRAALGVPESVTGYKVPDNVKDDPTIKGMADLALKVGLPAGQFDQMLNGVLQIADQQQKELNAEVLRVTTEDLNKLKAEWGGEFDAKAEYAKRFLRESGWNDQKVQRYEQVFGTAQMLRDFFQWGSKTGEAKFAGNGDSNGGFTPDKAEIHRQVEELRAKRVANQVTEKDFHAQMGILGPKLAAT